MSPRRHEHPTQSVAPGADPEQVGNNPPPQWVNPAQAAAAEFDTQPPNTYRWEFHNSAKGHETPE